MLYVSNMLLRNGEIKSTTCTIFPTPASPFLLTRPHTIVCRPKVHTHWPSQRRISSREVRINAINRMFLDSDPAVLLPPCHFHFERQSLDTETPPWNSAQPFKCADDAPSHTYTHIRTNTHTHTHSCLFMMQRMQFSLYLDNGAAL